MTIHKLLTKGFTFACGLALMAGLSQRALAIGTDAGTNVSNIAVVNYQVGGVAQELIESSDTGNAVSGAGNGSSTDFAVDHKVDLLVATTDGVAVAVAPSGTAYALEFTVTNNGNATEDYSLAATAVGTGNATFFNPLLLDAFDMNNVQVFVEDGNNGGYQPLEDTATYIDDLAEDATITVYIVADAPAVLTDNDLASYHLTATTRDALGSEAAPGAVLTESAADSVDPSTVDIVLADGIGTEATGDTSRDGEHSSQDDYIVQRAILTVTKTSTVIWDPFNLFANPKRIPGAIVQYEVDVTNAGSAAATSIEITDNLDSEVTAGTLSFMLGQYNGGTPTVPVADQDIELVHSTNGTSWLSAATDGDVGQIAANIVTVNNISLANSETATIRFQVEVQ